MSLSNRFSGGQWTMQLQCKATVIHKIFLTENKIYIVQVRFQPNAVKLLQYYYYVLYINDRHLAIQAASLDRWIKLTFDTYRKRKF